MKYKGIIILFKHISKVIIICLSISACSSGGGGAPDLIDNSNTINPPPQDQRYSFDTFENKMNSPWGDVIFNYSMSEYRFSGELPSNEKYKIEDYSFLQVRAQGQHPGNHSNKDEISLAGP